MKISKKELSKIIRKLNEELDYEDLPLPPYEGKAISGNLEKADELANEANELYAALAGLGDSFSGYAEIAYEITQLIGAHLESRQ
jgi:hypothetical protein